MARLRRTAVWKTASSVETTAVAARAGRRQPHACALRPCEPLSHLPQDALSFSPFPTALLRRAAPGSPLLTQRGNVCISRLCFPGDVRHLLPCDKVPPTWRSPSQGSVERAWRSPGPLRPQPRGAPARAPRGWDLPPYGGRWRWWPASSPPGPLQPRSSLIPGQTAVKSLLARPKPRVLRLPAKRRPSPAPSGLDAGH